MLSDAFIALMTLQEDLLKELGKELGDWASERSRREPVRPFWAALGEVR